jgi:adenylate cyclase
MINRYLNYLLFFLLPALLPVPAFSAPLLLDSHFNGEPVGKSIAYLIDKTNSLDITAVDALSEASFTPANVDVMSFGFNDSTYWIRLPVQNPAMSPVEWFLEVSYPMLDDLVLYEPIFSSESSNHAYRERIQGDMRNFQERDVDYRNFIFHLREEANSTKIYYIRIKSTSSIEVPMRAWSNIGLSEKINREQLIIGAYIGMMVIMAGYNLFLFLSIRDRSYLFYILFVISFTMFQLILIGIAFEYLWPNSAWLANKSLPFIILLASGTSLLFAREFLHIRSHAPIVNRYFLAGITLNLVLAPVTLYFSYSISIHLALIVTALSVILLLGSGFLGLTRRYRPAYFFMSAWFALLVAVILYILKSYGYLPSNFFTSWAILIGSSIEILLHSLGLADRYNIMKIEKDSAERELLESRLAMYDAVSRFVPSQFLMFLEKESIEEIQVGDSVQKHMTVLFSDIRRFTSFSEKMDANDNFRFLNGYLKRLGPAIQHHKGFIDKFIGDAIMALFAGSGDDAVRAAIEIMQELQKYNVERVGWGHDPIYNGIGINSGDLMLGTVGFDIRLNTTVIGDTVNLASRLEQLTKVYRVPILISDHTYRELSNSEDYHIREIDAVRVRGKQMPIDIYEVFDTDPEEVRDCKIKNLPNHISGLAAYKAGYFKEALSIFERCYSVCNKDPITQIYINRCKSLIINPPGDQWRGVSRVK